MKVINLLMVAIVLLASCEKEDDASSTNTPENQLKITHMPLSVGNYWVYQYYKIDTNGTETELTKQDSVYVIGDTIINNNTYIALGSVIISQPNSIVNYSFYRDSIGYLVNNRGVILFSETNFTDTLQVDVSLYEGDTTYMVSWMMENYNNTISLPIGVFDNILNYKGTLCLGINPNNVENPRFQNNYYSDNIGIIQENYYYLNGSDSFEKRLINYHVN